ALIRFGRMPRYGWKEATYTFCDRFKLSCSVLDFKKKASSVITTATGRKYSQRKFKDECNKRHKTIESFFDDRSIQESRFQQQVKNSLAEIIQNLDTLGVEDVENPPKIPAENLDHQILELIDFSIQDHLSRHKPSSMSEIAKLFQASQICYKRMTQKKKNPSTWKENIKKKIVKSQDSASLVKKAVENVSLSEMEANSLKKLMREINLSPRRSKDLKSAQTIFNEKEVIFKKKLEMHER
ncbi:hypothetical protein NGRA_3317, partial [Nosema granulosis]